MRPLPKEIGNLSAAEKFDLLDAIWENLETNALPLIKEQQAELDYRTARYEQDPTNLIAWERVRTKSKSTEFSSHITTGNS